MSEMPPGQPDPQQPVPQQPAPQQPVPQYAAPQNPASLKPKGSGLAIAALVLGIVTAVISFIPFLNQFAFFTGVVGLILAIIALVKKTPSRGSAITGLILSVVGMIIATIVIIITMAFLNTVKDSVDKAGAGVTSAMNKETKVKYVVTSDIPVKADYRSVQGSENAPVQGTWEKEVTFTGFNTPYVSVMPDDFMQKGTVTCEIFIDGASVSKKSGDSTINCSGTVK